MQACTILLYHIGLLHMCKYMAYTCDSIQYNRFGSIFISAAIALKYSKLIRGKPEAGQAMFYHFLGIL